jgi:hypothetical protein
MENNTSIRDLISSLHQDIGELNNKLSAIDTKLGETREEFIREIGRLCTNLAVLKVKNGLLSAFLGLIGGAIPVTIFIVFKLA